MTKLKICVVGDSDVGKSSIVSRFLHQNKTPRCSHTIGVDVTITSFNFFSHTYRINFYDVSGMVGYEKLYDQYLMNATSTVVVYDITKYKTFIRAKEIMNRVYTIHSDDFPVILIGNKKDAIPKRRVPMKEALNYTKSLGNVFFVECSALEGTNVQEAFKMLVAESSRGTNFVQRSVNNESSEGINCKIM